MRKKDPANTEKRKQEILRAAENCFVEKGFHQTNMRHIAEAAGLSLGNIYRYYENKGDLVNAFIREQDLEVIPYVKNLEKAWRFKQALKEIIKAYYDELSDPKRAALFIEVYGASLRDPDSYALKDSDNQFEALFTEQLQLAQDAGKVTCMLPVKTTAIAILALTDEFATSQHLKPKGEASFKELWQAIEYLIGAKK